MSIDIQFVAARVKICTLRTGAWRANKLNRKETTAINARHGLVQGTAKVPVHVCNHPALAALSKLHGEAYEYHIRVTRPSVDDAIRLLPMCIEIEHAQKMTYFRMQHEKIVKQFLTDYPQEMASAPSKLNGLYDASAWPSVESIASKFRFDTSYRPCPTEGEWGDWLSVSVQAAQLELQEKLEEAIRRVAERCASDGKLYQSVFDNLKELIDLVPALDLANDPKIAAIIKQAEILADNDKDVVVASPRTRKQVAEDANKILSIFGGLK